MIDTLLEGADDATRAVVMETPRAATQFLDPTGAVIGDTLREEEGIAYATFNLDACVEPKQFHDIVGYYNRFDIFDLAIDRKRLTPARFLGEAFSPEPVADEDAAAVL